MHFISLLADRWPSFLSRPALIWWPVSCCNSRPLSPVHFNVRLRTDSEHHLKARGGSPFFSSTCLPDSSRESDSSLKPVVVILAYDEYHTSATQDYVAERRHAGNIAVRRPVVNVCPQSELHGGRSRKRRSLLGIKSNNSQRLTNYAILSAAALTKEYSLHSVIIEHRDSDGNYFR